MQDLIDLHFLYFLHFLPLLIVISLEFSIFVPCYIIAEKYY